MQNIVLAMAGPSKSCVNFIGRGFSHELKKIVRYYNQRSSSTPDVKSSAASRNSSWFDWQSASADISQAYTPPSSWYVDSKFFNLIEAAVTFPNAWLLAGEVSSLTSIGDYIAGNALGKHPWVVVKTEEGKFNGFYNVCRHHASQIVDDGFGSLSSTHSNNNNRKRFICPYHGWQYTMDGRLAQANKMQGCLNFKAKDNGLHPILVDVIGPWIFIRLNTEGSKGSLVADQPDMKMFFDMLSETQYDNLIKVHSKSYVIQCNYKVYLDNYLDGGYHVPYAHPGLNDELDMSSYTLAEHTNFFLQKCNPAFPAVNSSSSPSSFASSTRMSGGDNKDVTVTQAESSSVRRLLNDTATAEPQEQEGKDGSAAALYLFHYPNLCVNRYGLWLDTNIVWPLSSRECRVDFHWYVASQKAEDAKYIASCVAQSERVQQEDIWLCERVQKGIDSPVYTRGGRYAPSVEKGEFMFHRRLYEDVLKAAVT